MNGTLKTGSRLRFMQAGAVHDADEIGVRRPDHTPVAALGPGETGYLIAGIKDVARGPLGRDRHRRRPPGRRRRSRATASRSRWCSAGCTRSTATSSPTCARRSRSCGSTTARYTYEPETSGALGFGFRCGFLGLLHMEIVRERLEREFDLDLIATAPSVAYLVHKTDGEVIEVDNPSALPETVSIEFIEEPMLTCTILTPKDYTGTIMELCQNRRGEMSKLEYLSPERVELDLQGAARRGGARLLRPAEEPHPGLRHPRLRAGRLRARRPGEGRRAPQRRAGRRLLHHPPPRQGAGLRPAHVREAQGADPAPDVRRADPGRHRRARSSAARR